MRTLLVGFVLVFIGCLSVLADDSFDDVQILERDVARIKKTGDLRGGEKLMKVVVRFRDADVMIAGNDYRYGYLIVIPYSAIGSMIYSDIEGRLPDQLHRAAPLYQENFDGQDQRWFAMQYERGGQTEDVLLMLAKETDEAFLKALAGRLKKEVVRYTDGVPRLGDDVLFRDCRVFKTVSDDQGKSETDDYACMVMMRADAFQFIGQYKDYQEHFVVPYASVRGLFYEHAKQTSYMGRMPGISAFRKEKHWFVIEGEGTTALVLAPEIVADFREVAQAKTNISINAYGGRGASELPVSVLPDVLGVGAPDETVIEILMSAKSIRCLLGPGTRALWSDGKLDRNSDARYGDGASELIFDAIDLQKQTAILHTRETKTAVRVVASEMGLTFLAVDDATSVTTVFARSDGQLVCVHSHHVAGASPQASQFYGVAEVVDKQ